MDYIIECPKHNGRFDYRTGAAKGAPVCVNLNTYPVKVEGDDVLIELSMPMAGMVIIGAGECGTRAALALREAGYDGPVTLIGAEPHAPYERPPLSKDAIVGERCPTPQAIAGAAGLARGRRSPSAPAPPRRRSTAPRRTVALRRRRGARPTTACSLATGARPRRCRCPAPTAPTPRRCAPSTTPPASAPPSAPAGGSRSSAAASSASSSPPPPAASAPRSR